MWWKDACPGCWSRGVKRSLAASADRLPSTEEDIVLACRAAVRKCGAVRVVEAGEDDVVGRKDGSGNTSVVVVVVVLSAWHCNAARVTAKGLSIDATSA